MFTNLQNKTLSILGRTNTQNSSGQISESWGVISSNVPCRFSEAPKNFTITDDKYKVTKETFVFFLSPELAGVVSKDNRILYEGKEYYLVKVSAFQGQVSTHHLECYAQIVSVGGQSGLQSPFDTSNFVPKSTKVNGKPLTGDIVLDKSDIGLGNVDNTSDINKPISTAVQAALDQEQDIGTNYDDKNYQQAFNSNVVVVNHNLGKQPSVLVIDSSGAEVEGDVVHNSINQLTITFSASFSGVVYCN